MEQPRTASFVTTRLWSRFAGAGEPPPGIAVADVTAILRGLLTAPEFVAARGQLVKQPVEWLVGALRQLGIRPTALAQRQQRQLLAGLNGLGQVPLRPPSVGGWPAGESWLTISTLQARMRLAELLATAAGPVVDRRLAAAPAQSRPDALARLLVIDGWTERTRAALAPLSDQPRRLLSTGLVSPEYVVH